MEDNMKRVLTIVIAAATLASCSKQSAGFVESPDEQGFGSLKIDVVDNTTRAGERIYLNEMYSDWSDPHWEQTLAVQLACETEDATIDGESAFKAYRSVLMFNDAREGLPAGDQYSYTVKVVSQGTGNKLYDYIDPASGTSVSWSDALYSKAALVPDAPEGERAPYFEGKAAGVTVEKGTTTNVDLNVYVANTAVCFEFTEAFRNYFAEAHLTLTTAAGHSFNIDYDAATPYTKTYFWINPRSFTVSGTVKRQSPGTGVEGAVETLETESFSDANVNPRYCYTCKYDISSVGGTANGGITITYDDQPIGSVTVGDFEVNPDAE